jgi:hypothetical protein
MSLPDERMGRISLVVIVVVLLLLLLLFGFAFRSVFVLMFFQQCEASLERLLAQG